MSHTWLNNEVGWEGTGFLFFCFLAYMHVVIQAEYTFRYHSQFLKHTFIICPSTGILDFG